MGRRKKPNAGGDGRKAGRIVGNIVWISIPVVSFGLFAWFPAVYAYWRERRVEWLIVALALFLGAVLLVIGAATDDGGMITLSWLGTTLIGVAVAGESRGAFGDYRGAHAEEEVPRAVRTVLRKRGRREKAREIAMRDPAMAFELHIGRPDLPDVYNDGDLVDLNNVTAGGLVDALGWPRYIAEEFVAERDQRGGYQSFTEITALSGLSPQFLDRDRDHIVVLPFRPSDRLL